MRNIVQDLREGVRALRRSPGFAAAVIAPLALGLGINTGVFSIFHNVMLGALPVPEPGELVTVYQEFRGVQGRHVSGARSMFSRPEYEAYRDATRTLSGTTAYTASWKVTLGGRSPQELEGRLVACNYFDVLEVRPFIGTAFAAGCEEPAARPTVVLSHALWTRVFEADPALIGRTVTLNGLDVTVAGVAPEGFDGTEVVRAAFFAPLSLQPLLERDRNFLHEPQVSWLALLGRRRPDATIDQVRAELGVVAARIDGQQPGRETTLLIAPATAVSLPVARHDVANVAVVVAIACALILMIVCANVANVLLARGEMRARELAIRLALGASRPRIARLVLIESAIIAAAGGAAGSLLAWWSFRALLPPMLASVPGLSAPRVDPAPSAAALWFGVALTSLTACLCGLVPAVKAARRDPRAGVNGAYTRAGDRSRSWVRGATVGIQVAVCLVLLVATALLLRAVQAAYTIEPGFESEHVVVVSVDLRGRAMDAAAAQSLRQRITDAIGALPGVAGVASVGRVPLSPGRTQDAFRLAPGEPALEFDVNEVSPNYFALLRIPLVSGRTFTRDELDGGAQAVIVSQSTARRLWPGQDPLGRALLPEAETAPRVVVGVVADVRASIDADTRSSALYLPTAAAVPNRIRMLVKGQGGFDPLAADVRSRVAGLDRTLLADVQPLAATMSAWRQRARSVAALAGMLSGLALVLACVGVYGVVSYVVTCRRRDLGIRMALGATPRTIHGFVLRQTLRPVFVGLLVGAGGAAAGSRLLEGALFGIDPLDPIAFMAATVTLLAMAAVAAFLPSWRSMKLDPLTTLKHG